MPFGWNILVDLFSEVNPRLEIFKFFFLFIPWDVPSALHTFLML